MPKKVWKTSASLPGLSAIPPSAPSWHLRMKARSAPPSIHASRPSIRRLESTHQE